VCRWNACLTPYENVASHNTVICPVQLRAEEIYPNTCTLRDTYIDTWIHKYIDRQINF